MAFFDYVAVDSSGAQVKGRMSAFSPPEVEDLLRGKGLWPVRVTRREQRERQPVFKGRANRRDKIFICVRLGFMLGAGVPISQALEEVAESAEKPAIKEILKEVRRQIEEGTPLWQALHGQRGFLSVLHINMIRAGEEGGKLAETFLKVGEYIEEEAEFMRQITQAVAYPIMASLVVFGVLLFYIFQVFPQMVPLLEDLGAQTKDLPVLSRFLLWVGRNPVPSALGVMTPPLALGIFLLLVSVSDKLRLWWDRKKLRLPLVGWPMLCATYARVSQAMEALIGSGVSIIEVLDLTAGVAGNAYVCRQVTCIRDRLGHGESIHEASKNEAFPPIFSSLLKTGETSGHLEPVLAQLTKFFESDLRYHTRRLMAYIEPILLMFLAGIMIVIVVGVLYPVYENLGNLRR